MVLFFALFGFLFLSTQYLQFVLGYSPLAAGVRVLPYAGAMIVCAPLSAKLVATLRHQARRRRRDAAVRGRPGGRGDGRRRAPATAGSAVALRADGRRHGTRRRAGDRVDHELAAARAGRTSGRRSTTRRASSAARSASPSSAASCPRSRGARPPTSSTRCRRPRWSAPACARPARWSPRAGCPRRGAPDDGTPGETAACRRAGADVASAGMSITEVPIAPLPLERFREVLDVDRWKELEVTRERSRERLAGRVEWNVNSTAHGGGVGEMLALLAYARGAGVDTRWVVVDGTPDFFAAHQAPPQPPPRLRRRRRPARADEHRLYEQTLRDAAGELRRAGTAGRHRRAARPPDRRPRPRARARRPRRLALHIGRDEPTSTPTPPGSFLLRYLEPAVGVRLLPA